MWLTQEERVLRQLNRAQGYLMLGLPGRAREILENLGFQAGMGFEACFLTGEMFRQFGMYREALLALERAAKLKPGDVGVAMALGWCYKRTNRLAQAIDSLERAATAHPAEPMLHFNLGCYWSQAGQEDRALDALARAIELDPSIRLWAGTEPDFEPVRGHPRFERLVQGQAASR